MVHAILLHLMEVDIIFYDILLINLNNYSKNFQVIYRGCTLGTPFKSLGRTAGPVKFKNATYYLCTTNL